MSRLITKDELLYLHQLNIEAFGGAMGVRDESLLESALAQPLATFGGRDLYPTCFAKVAALGFSLISNHAFVDGNKRVGFAAMAAVLRRNGFELDCTVDEGERIALAVASGECNREALTVWIQEHARQLPELGRDRS